MSSTAPSSPSSPDDPVASAATATAELAVAGMHCGACVALIEESLTEHDGVSEASVDLDAGRAVVRYDPGLLGVDVLQAIVADAGYSAAPVG